MFSSLTKKKKKSEFNLTLRSLTVVHGGVKSSRRARLHMVLVSRSFISGVEGGEGGRPASRVLPVLLR